MADHSGVRIQGHRRNISRYEKLLKTYLIDVEREYVERRLSEEISALQILMQRGQRVIDF
jgi:hypothetical protein